MPDFRHALEAREGGEEGVSPLFAVAGAFSLLSFVRGDGSLFPTVFVSSPLF
jgi:hypothetical protein